LPIRRTLSAPAGVTSASSSRRAADAKATAGVTNGISGRSQAGCPRAAMIERHYGTMIEGAAADITRRLDAFDARHARDLERDHED